MVIIRFSVKHTAWAKYLKFYTQKIVLEVFYAVRFNLVLIDTLILSKEVVLHRLIILKIIQTALAVALKTAGKYKQIFIYLLDFFYNNGMLCLWESKQNPVYCLWFFIHVFIALEMQ